MIKDIRNIEKALGTCTYKLTDFQKRGLKNARSLYVVEDIKKGEVFSENNIRSIRPGKGLAPWYFDEIIGKKATINIKRGTAMKWEYIKKE